MSKKLKWHEEIGENDERVLEASSIYLADVESSPLQFRITETADGFIESSDGELYIHAPRRWASLEEAKAAMQADHEKMIAAESLK